MKIIQTLLLAFIILKTQYGLKHCRNIADFNVIDYTKGDTDFRFSYYTNLVGIPNKVILKHKLGAGGFGEVFQHKIRFLGHSEPSDTAIKIINTNKVDLSELDNEINYLESLHKHYPLHFVKYYGCAQNYNPDKVFLFQEKLKGDLFNKRTKQKYFLDQPWSVKLGLLHMMAESLLYVSMLKLVHSDVKIENLMVTEQNGVYLAKLIDYGLMQQLHSEKFGGTKDCLDPRTSKIPFALDSDVDSFALGITFSDLLYGVSHSELKKSCLYTYAMHRRCVEERTNRLINFFSWKMTKYTPEDKEIYTVLHDIIINSQKISVSERYTMLEIVTKLENLLRKVDEDSIYLLENRDKLLDKIFPRSQQVGSLKHDYIIKSSYSVYEDPNPRKRVNKYYKSKSKKELVNNNVIQYQPVTNSALPIRKKPTFDQVLPKNPEIEDDFNPDVEVDETKIYKPLKPMQPDPIDGEINYYRQTNHKNSSHLSMIDRRNPPFQYPTKENNENNQIVYSDNKKHNRYQPISRNFLLKNIENKNEPFSKYVDKQSGHTKMNQGIKNTVSTVKINLQPIYANNNFQSSEQQSQNKIISSNNINQITPDNQYGRIPNNNNFIANGQNYPAHNYKQPYQYYQKILQNTNYASNNSIYNQEPKKNIQYQPQAIYEPRKNYAYKQKENTQLDQGTKYQNYPAQNIRQIHQYYKKNSQYPTYGSKNLLFNQEPKKDIRYKPQAIYVNNRVI